MKLMLLHGLHQKLFEKVRQKLFRPIQLWLEQELVSEKLQSTLLKCQQVKM